MRLFVIALQFLTTLPLRLCAPPREPELGRSMLCYPLIGLILGVLLASLAMLFDTLSTLLAASLILTCWVWLTGALHLDGLADSADAWRGGQGDRDRTLKIMKDPRSGPTGICVLISVLLMKLAAIAALLDAGNFVGLLLAPLLARTGLLLLFLNTPYVRPSGICGGWLGHLPRTGGRAVVMLGYAAATSIDGYTGLCAATGALLTFCGLRYAMIKRIGGTTGDTAGALVEITELAVLITLAVIQGIQQPIE